LSPFTHNKLRKCTPLSSYSAANPGLYNIKESIPISPAITPPPTASEDAAPVNMVGGAEVLGVDGCPPTLTTPPLTPVEGTVLVFVFLARALKASRLLGPDALYSSNVVLAAVQRR
jgi:hypothetical protein